MERELVEIILEQTKILLANVETTLKTCNLSYILCGMPVWKHFYHALHSLDQWFINPDNYQEPPFHEQGLNSLDEKSHRILTRDELHHYYHKIEDKIYAYLRSLDDSRLAEKPEKCEFSRLALILGQYRHLSHHMANINATTMIEHNKWPKVIGLEADNLEGYYE